MNSTEEHKDMITSISTFPSGNIISVSRDKSIIIYDIHLNILQNIQKAHDNIINYVEVKDENNFVTCSNDKSIKLWIKKEHEYINNQIINEAHDSTITKVIYYSNRNLISSSYKKIKIWKENNDNYDNIQSLTHSNWVESILYLEDKGVLISSGKDGTKFWDLKKNETNFKNIKCNKYIKEIKCYMKNALCRIDDDRIIIGGDKSVKVISLFNKNVIKDFFIPFQCWGICLIKYKDIFLIGGDSKDLRVYNNEDYECIQIIQNRHDECINGFVELKDGTIISYSDKMKVEYLI